MRKILLILSCCLALFCQAQVSDPLLKKKLARYHLGSVEGKYGKLTNAKMRDYETYDFLVNCNERNNAIFPVLMECGFRERNMSRCVIR